MRQTEGTSRRSFRVIDRGPRILFAEDCPHDNRQLVRQLQHAGFDVTLECSEYSAFDRLAKGAAPGGIAFDAVLLKLQHPLLDDAKLVQETRRRGFDGAVIVLIEKTNDRQDCQFRVEVSSGCQQNSSDLDRLLNIVTSSAGRRSVAL